MIQKVLLFLSFACILLLCGCSQKTPQQLFQQAVSTTLSQSALQAHTQLELQLSAQGVTMPVSVTMDSAIQLGESPVSATDLSVSMLGMELSGNLYTLDGKRYVNQLGAKTVQENGTPSPSFYVLLSTWSELSEDDLASLTAQSSAGGSTVLSGSFDGDQLSQTVSASLQQFTGSAPFALQTVEFSAVIARSGEFESITLEAPLVLDQSESTDSTFLMKIDILNTGDDVTVQLPDDLESYIKID